MDSHPVFRPFETGDTVRFVVDPDHPGGPEPHIGTVESSSTSEAALDGGTASLIIEESRPSTDTWHLEAQKTDASWTQPRVVKRLYSKGETTEFVEAGGLSALETVDLGVARTDLTPGLDVEWWTGETYRVIVPPAGRDHDDNVLAYNLESAGNMAECLAPSGIRTIRGEADA